MKRLGDRVGRILLTEVLGTGGMGDIFVGLDERLGREVAVKAIRPEVLSQEIRARLMREARLLSTLDHENICRIYELIEEGDETFLVLELIRGRNLRQVLEAGVGDRRKLEIAERIAVALNAAHRSEIIHRDLKLENVMVRADDVIKVLDFGVGRSLQDEPWPSTTGPRSPVVGRNRESSLTILGEAIGTVSTMSPEQARGETVTAATDLYSFGLLLQELFTGRSPYPPNLPDEVLWLRAKDGDTVPVEGVDAAIAALIAELKSPRPEERPTASAAVELLRRIRTRTRRRLQWAAIATLILLALGAGAKYTIDLRWERNAAVEARREAERRGKESEAVVDFLVGLFESSDPNAARGRDPRASELLDRGAEKVTTALADQPLVRARLMETIGRVSRLLGNADRAEELYTSALDIRCRHQEPNHLDIARAEAELGDLMRTLGRFDDAETWLEASRAKLEESPEQDALAVARVLNRLGALALQTGRLQEALSFFDQVVEIRRQALGDDDPMVIVARNNLAITYRQLGRLDDAATEHQEVLRLRRQRYGSDHPDVATSLNNLAVASYIRGDLDDAEIRLGEALAIWRQVLGDEHPEVATALSNLGDIAVEKADLEVAEERYQEALAIWQAAFGPEHPNLAYSLQGLGNIARQRGDRETAVTFYSEALRLREAVLPADHPEVVETRQALKGVRTFETSRP